MHRPRAEKDLGGGLLLAAIAATILWSVKDLDIGTLTELGPGYIPLALGVLIGCFGLFLVGRSFVLSGPALEGIAIRPILLLLGSVLLFSLLLERVGLLVAAFAMVVMSSFATDDAKPRETLIFATAASLFCVALFIGAFRMTVKAWPW